MEGIFQAIQNSANVAEYDPSANVSIEDWGKILTEAHKRFMENYVPLEDRLKIDYPSLFDCREFRK